MVIVALCLIPIMSALTGYIALKAYMQGIKHNYELRNNISPSKLTNPISDYIEHKQEEKQEKEQENIMSQWLHGAE